MRDRVLTSAIFATLFVSLFACLSLVSTATTASGSSLEPQQRRSRQTPRRRPAAQPTQRTPRRDYANFSHRTKEHQRECSSCHQFPTPNWNQVRKGDAAFQDVTDYPPHAACVSCHRQQYFRGTRPTICINCHVRTTPAGGPRHPFPNPRELFDASPKGKTSYTEFNINFPHVIHMEIVTARSREASTETPGASFTARAFSHRASLRQETENCSVCHQTYQPQGDSDVEFVTAPPKDLAEDAFWLKKGTFKTSPIGHKTCFTCHSAEGGIEPAPSKCNVCHKLLPPVTERADFDPQLAKTMGISDKITLEKWRKREAGRYRHEWISHAELKCASCHDVTEMDTLDEKTKKVQILSCGGTGGCHIGDPDSVLNMAVAKKQADPKFQCMKCHVIFGKEALPPSHVNAVTNFKPK